MGPEDKGYNSAVEADDIPRRVLAWSVEIRPIEIAPFPSSRYLILVILYNPTYAAYLGVSPI